MPTPTPLSRPVVGDGSWCRTARFSPLPDGLAAAFPGSANQSAGRSACVRLQTILDLLTESLCHLSVEPYARNDQAACRDITAIAGPGDLVIRDLGYFVLDVLSQIDRAHVAFISRLRRNVGIYGPDGQRLDMLAVLRRTGGYDGPVLMGAKQKLPVRLVALRVPPQVGAARRRRMRNDRDRRLKPKAKALALQDWDIFVTNTKPEELTAGQIARFYRCRWRIETVFRTFKAALRDKVIEPTASAEQALILLYAHLLRASLIVGPVWELLCRQARGRRGRLSLQRTSRFLQDHFAAVLKVILTGRDEYLADLLRQHCTYDSRARPTYRQRFARLRLETQLPQLPAASEP